MDLQPSIEFTFYNRGYGPPPEISEDAAAADPLAVLQRALTCCSYEETWTPVTHKALNAIAKECRDKKPFHSFRAALLDRICYITRERSAFVALETIIDEMKRCRSKYPIDSELCRIQRRLLPCPSGAGERRKFL